MQPGHHEHPFYKPLWRRIAMVGTCFLWACVETYFKGQPLWLMLAWGITAYAFWTFIVNYPKDTPAP